MIKFIADKFKKNEICNNKYILLYFKLVQLVRGRWVFVRNGIENDFLLSPSIKKKINTRLHRIQFTVFSN